MSTIFVNRRQQQTPLSTLGRLDDLGWGCDIWILEPGAHAAPHQRIAAGDYPLALRAEGGKYATFMAVPELRAMIRPGLPHLLMSPDRLVLVHPGNTYRDSEACQLPGLGRLTPRLSNSGEWEVTQSRAALLRLYPFVRRAVEGGGAVWRTIDMGGP